MVVMKKLCYPALVTPIKSSGTNLNSGINYNALGKLVDYVVANGVDGVVVAGCTGHAASLTMDEQVELIEYVNKNWGHKTEVIAGDGSNCTRESIEFAQRVEKEAKVFRHLQISPYQNKPEQNGIYEHYKSVAGSIEGDIILYSVPGRTGGKGILPETAARLAEINNIVGIKEASGDLERIAKTIELTKNHDFFVISGDDGMTFKIMALEGVGVISVAANVCPHGVAEMVHCFDEDYNKTAGNRSLQLDNKMRGLYDVLFLETNPQPAHYALRRIGIDAGIPRLPLIDAREETKREIDVVLKDLGLI